MTTEEGSGAGSNQVDELEAEFVAYYTSQKDPGVDLPYRGEPWSERGCFRGGWHARDSEVAQLRADLEAARGENQRLKTALRDTVGRRQAEQVRADLAQARAAGGEVQGDGEPR